MGETVETEGVAEARVDLWLWAVRLYKTRSQAATACRGGKVRVNGKPAKPAKLVRAGDRLEISKTGLTKTVKVRDVLSKRIGAKLVEDYLEDLTPPEIYEEAAQRRLEKIASVPKRDGGAGRPTKRDRRAWSKAAEKAAEREAAVIDLMKKSVKSSGDD